MMDDRYYHRRAIIQRSPSGGAIPPVDPANPFLKYPVTGFYVKDLDPTRQVNGIPRLFTTAGGGTPCASASDTIGLVLDESLGLALGADVVVNGGFASDTVWSKGTDWSIAAGVASKTAGTQANLTQSGILTVGRLYRITFDAVVSAGALAVYAGVSATADAISATGSYTRYAICVGDTALYIQGNAAFAGSIDNIVVQEVAGNHFHMQTSAARGVLQSALSQYVWRGDGVDDNLLGTIAGGGNPACMIITGTWTAVSDNFFGIQDASSGGRFKGLLTAAGLIGGNYGNNSSSIIFDSAGLFPDNRNLPGVFALKGVTSGLCQLWWRPAGGPPTKLYEGATVAAPSSVVPFRIGCDMPSAGSPASFLAGDLYRWLFMRANISESDLIVLMNALAPN
jgi:hypothetical protein